MQVAIDGSHLTCENMSGTHNYLYNLLNHLAKLDNRNKYVIYYKNDIPSDFLSNMCHNNSNFSFKQLSSYVSWTQVALARALYKNTPDVLLCPWQTIPIFHKKSMKIVSVIHAADEYAWFLGGSTFYSALFSDKIIAVSNYTKSVILRKYFIPESKVCVIHEGVDHKYFNKKSDDEISHVKAKYDIKGKYIFFVGTLVKRKNVKRMLEAFKCLQNGLGVDDFGLTFVLGGVVPSKNKSVLSLPQRLEIESKVKFLGRVAQADLPALLSGAEFLSYVSLSEGFGLPVLEAMSCGTAVLTSNSGALPEITNMSDISDPSRVSNSVQNAAYLVDPMNVSAIYSGMQHLCNRNNNLKYVNFGFDNAKRYTWTKTAQDVLDALSF